MATRGLTHFLRRTLHGRHSDDNIFLTEKTGLERFGPSVRPSGWEVTKPALFPGTDHTENFTLNACSSSLPQLPMLMVHLGATSLLPLLLCPSDGVLLYILSSAS